MNFVQTSFGPPLSWQFSIICIVRHSICLCLLYQLNYELMSDRYYPSDKFGDNQGAIAFDLHDKITSSSCHIFNSQNTVFVFNWADGIGKILTDILPLSILHCPFKICEIGVLFVDTAFNVNNVAPKWPSGQSHFRLYILLVKNGNALSVLNVPQNYAKFQQLISERCVVSSAKQHGRAYDSGKEVYV